MSAKNTCVLCFLFLFNGCAFADEYRFHFSATGKVVGIHDVAVIDILFDQPFKGVYDEEEMAGVSGHYFGIDHEQLAVLASEKAELRIEYGFSQGAKVVLPLNEASFLMLGSSLQQIIELARQQCLKDSIPSLYCNELALHAWDAELNRAYQRRGGSNNILLRDSQRAWLRFFELEKEALRQHYSKREGSFWKHEYTAKVARLIKERTLHMDDLLIW